MHVSTSREIIRKFKSSTEIKISGGEPYQIKEVNSSIMPEIKINGGEPYQIKEVNSSIMPFLYTSLVHVR